MIITDCLFLFPFLKMNIFMELILLKIKIIKGKIGIIKIREEMRMNIMKMIIIIMLGMIIIIIMEIIIWY